MGTIKAVVFDVGGVLIKISPAIRDNIALRLGIDQATFGAIWKELVLLHGAGKISEQEFWQRLGAQCDFDTNKYPSSLIGEVFTELLEPYPEALALASKLRDRGIATAVLSNTIESHSQIVREAGVYDGFSPVLLSNEVGMRKPDPEIYNYTISALGVAPQEIVFIDDDPTNTKVAESLGIHTITLLDPKQLEQEIKRFIPDL